MSAREADQAKAREYRYFRDQHGRRYGAPVEIRTGDPCGPWEPQFVAPLTPNPDFMRIVKDEDQRRSIFVDYDGWIAEVQTRLTNWQREVRKAMIARHRENYHPTMRIDADVYDLPTTGPEPSIGARWVPGTVKPLVAAKAGNKWVLGLSEVDDPRVSKFLLADVAAEDEDFAADYDAEFEKSMAIEEEVDPEAVGGKPRRAHRRTKPLAEVDS